MAKFKIAVLAGVAAVYPFGQEHEGKTLKEGEGVDLEVPALHAEAKDGSVLSAVQDDRTVPAAGVAQDEPYGKREGTLEVAVSQGTVTLRTYDGSSYTEKLLQAGDKEAVPVTESNRITLAVYEAGPEPKQAA